MATVAVSRTPIARLTVDGSPYPLDSGTLLVVTRPDGRSEWQVSAASRLIWHLDQASPHRLLIIAAGHSFTGTAWLRDEPVTDGRMRHRFVGSGQLETPA